MTSAFHTAVLQEAEWQFERGIEMAKQQRFEDGDQVEVSFPQTNNSPKDGQPPSVTPSHETYGTVIAVRPTEFKVAFDTPYVHDGKEERDGWFAHGDKAVKAADMPEAIALGGK